jgi:hypothetical protein
VHGGPDSATGDPRTVNEISAMYGTPDEIAERLDGLREAGVGYVLLNGGGSPGRRSQSAVHQDQGRQIGV